MKIQTQHTFNYKECKGEKISTISLTIKDEAYTIRELLKKHTRGIMPDIERIPQYQEGATHDSLDLQKYNRLDIVDKKEQQATHKRSVELLMSEAQERIDLKAEKEARQKLEATEERAKVTEGNKQPSEEDPNSVRIEKQPTKNLRETQIK